MAGVDESLRKVLVLVGGTDPSGGAGLPADIKSASAMGVHGCPVVSAITVQDSGRVSFWEPLDAGLVTAQLESILQDGPVSGIKTGMIGSLANARALGDFISRNMEGLPFVMDPVAASGNGTPLQEKGMRDEILEHLLPLCTLCTPNIAEAETLSGIPGIDSVDGMVQAGRSIMEHGAGAVLVKGGHLREDPADVLITPEGCRIFQGRRLTEETVHGTGCTFATACASLLSEGQDMVKAVDGARRFVERAISRRLKRRRGNLPGHFPGALPVPGELDGTSYYMPPEYCSRCGAVMYRSAGDTGHYYCERCGYLHYRNPIPAVSLVVRKGNSILLVKRGVPPAMGMLCLPGGFLETGEEPVECGTRELAEETGLTALKTNTLGLETDYTAYGSILLVVLEVTSYSGTPSPGDDASEVMWMDIDKVPPLAFSAHNRILERLRDNSEAFQ